MSGDAIDEICRRVASQKSELHFFHYNNKCARKAMVLLVFSDIHEQY